MRATESILKLIEQAKAEGRVTEGPQAVLPAPELTPAEVTQSEKQFQADVVKFGKRHGWKTYHTYDSRRSDKGFVDLVMVRGRVVWAELKVGSNKTTADQDAWIEALCAAGEEVYVWYPKDWPQIETVLGGQP